MWRTVLAVILSILTIFSAFWAYHYTTSICDDLVKELPLSCTETCVEDLLRSQQRFEKYEPLLSTFYVHDSIDEIHSAFTLCLGYARQEDAKNYEVHASLLSHLIYDLPRSDTPNIKNIF